MKKLLIAFMLLGGVSKAQDVITTGQTGGQTATAISNIQIGNGNVQNISYRIQRRNDTVACKMLVTMGDNNICKQVSGFCVTSSDSFYATYLDDKKHPMIKNAIVWQSTSTATGL